MAYINFDKRYYVTYPIIKIELTLGENTYNISQLVNTKDCLLKQMRDKTSGVELSLTAPIEFYKQAAQLLHQEWQSKGIHGQASISLYLRHYIHNTYTLMKKWRLNFGTYEWSNGTVKLKAAEFSLQHYLKANQRTKYDIPVRGDSDKAIEAVNGWQMRYDRMQLVAQAGYIISEMESREISIGSGIYYYYPYISNTSVENPPDAVKHTAQDQNERYVDSSNNYFFKAERDVKTNIYLDFKVEIVRSKQAYFAPKLYLVCKNEATDEDRIFSLGKFGEPQQEDGKFIYSLNVNQNIENHPFSNLVQGDRLSLRASFDGDAAGVDVTVRFLRRTEQIDPSINIQWSTIGRRLYIDTIDPNLLLQRLIDLMAPGAGYRASIKWGDIGYHPVLIAAESIRGYDTANIHTSFDDFHEWMRCFGMERQYTDAGITYLPRDACFKQEVALDLSAAEVGADLTVGGDETYAYTALKVGYKKQEYESVNGKWEANGTFDYSTGYLTEQVTELSLISPYRGDSLGLELLTWERSNKSTDTKSDNDVFVVAANLTYEPESSNPEIMHYIYVPDPAPYTSGQINLFNYKINPAQMVLMNESLIGIVTNKVTFAGTDSSRLGETSLYADVPLAKKLFEPATYTLKVGRFAALPPSDNFNGLIRFSYHGETMQGFIKEIWKNYGREEESDWQLWMVKGS